MFSRKQTRRSDRLGPIRSIKHAALVRSGALALASTLAILLALIAPGCQASTSSSGDSDEHANTVSNPVAGARPITPLGAERGLGGASDGVTNDESEPAPAFTASNSPSALTGTPSSVLGTDSRAIHPATSRKCILFDATLCQALKRKPLVALATVQTVALVFDGVATRQFIRRGYSEVDPIARVLIGSKPTWGRMAPLGAVQVVAGMWLAERMATSRHVWIRRFWWLPQLMGIAGNAAATAHNLTLR